MCGYLTALWLPKHRLGTFLATRSNSFTAVTGTFFATISTKFRRNGERLYG